MISLCVRHRMNHNNPIVQLYKDDYIKKANKQKITEKESETKAERKRNVLVQQKKELRISFLEEFFFPRFVGKTAKC